MANEQHRHDITEAAWAVIEPHTIGNKGSWGGNARNTRLFINGVFWILRTGAPWRDIPKELISWTTAYNRFNRWSENGLWQNFF